jgi:hypothetical protein
MIDFANFYTNDLAGGISATHDMFLLGVLPPYTTSRDWVWDQRVSQFQELLRILKLTRSASLLSSVDMVRIRICTSDLWIRVFTSD